MQMNIEVLNVSPVMAATSKAGKPYNKIEVAYKRTMPDGKSKTEGKPLIDFNNPSIFKQVQEWKAGDVRSVTLDKDNNGYWQWTGIGAGTAESAPVVQASAGDRASEQSADTSAARPSYPQKAGVGKVTGSNYETPIERAARQRYIVAQSSITAALKFAEINKIKVASAEDLIPYADVFYNYAFSKNKDLSDIQSDPV